MGVNHNIIHLFRQDGLSQQQAYDQVDLLIHKAYHAWYVAHSEIPIWGEEVDAQVMLYVKGCQDMVLGNLNWRCVLLLSDYLFILCRSIPRLLFSACEQER